MALGTVLTGGATAFTLLAGVHDMTASEPLTLGGGTVGADPELERDTA
jgi:hypothetical protein